MATGSKFLRALRVKHLNGPWYELTYKFQFKSGVTDSIITVPEGFVTDFASIPRLPILYLLFGGKTDEAAVIHDYLYRVTDYSRSVADRVYLEAMRSQGYTCFSRVPMFLGVRLFGWYSYGKHEGLDPRGG